MTTTDPGATDGLPCACRFRGVEGAIKEGSETGVLVDPDEAIRECDLHKALRERVVELQAQNTMVSRRNGEYAKGMADANERAKAAEARVVALEGALGDAKEALNTWTCMVAPEFCDAGEVKRAKARIRDFGRLACIAKINEKITDALAAAFGKEQP